MDEAGIVSTRARALDRFVDLARYLLRERAELQSVTLMCAGDDGAREVLRDVWTLRGDPRGEFSALVADGTSSARAADFVAHYGRAWVGALQPVIPLSSALFGGGPFVSRAVVYAPDRGTFERVADAPDWGTVEAIAFAPGSYRGISPRMHRLRTVGPIGKADLGPLATGDWQISELDYELDRDGSIGALGRCPLPLRSLRLRGERVQLAELERAAWWSSLDRLELWLPGTTPEPARAIETMFETLLPSLPPRIAFAVGMLDDSVRSGWVLASTGGDRRLALVRPDRRDDIGAELAIVTGLPRVPTLLDGPDWLALALGVASDHSLRI